MYVHAHHKVSTTIGAYYLRTCNTHTYIHICTHIHYTQTYTHTYMYTRTYTHTYMYTSTYTHTNTHLHYDVHTVLTKIKFPLHIGMLREV